MWITYTVVQNKIFLIWKRIPILFIRHDITFPLYLEADEIFNLACPASPYYQRDPVQTIKVCVNGSVNMLGLAKDLMRPFCKPQLVKSMVIPRSTLKEIIGAGKSIGIRSCYDEGKRSAETLFLTITDSTNLI